MNLHKKKIIKMLVLSGLLTGFIFFPGDTTPIDGKVMGFNADDLVVRTPDGFILLFPFENGTFVGPGAGKQVGHGWYGFDYINYLVGNWTGNGIRDIIVQKKDGHLYLFPMKKETFYIRGSGRKVKENLSFNYTHYFVGKWTDNGTDDLLVRTADGVMLLFPFKNGAFVGPGAGKRVGQNWNFTHYLVGNWSGNSPSDMIVRTSNGDLYLHPFQHETFGSGKKVGENFHYTHYFVGNWTGSGTDDLLIRDAKGDMLLFPFKNGTFTVPGSGKRVGYGWNYTHYFVGNWTGNGTPDMIVRKTNGDLLLYPFANETFNVCGVGRKVGEGFHYEHYFVGQWTDDLGPAIPVFDFNDWAPNFPAAHSQGSQ
jgi:hypothetical protein